jgi:hypothetical protein
MASNPRRGNAGGTIGHQAWRPVDRPEPVIACGHPARPDRAARPTNLHTGPHNRCSHATPPPVGLIPCRGDHACPYRLKPGQGELCPEHARESRLTVADLRAEAARSFGMSIEDTDRLMGASPGSAGG